MTKKEILKELRSLKKDLINARVRMSDLATYTRSTEMGRTLHMMAEQTAVASDRLAAYGIVVEKEIKSE